jgi:putative spermidine/putrescine transport system permease protein
MVLPLVIFAATVFLYPIIDMAVSTLVVADPATGAHSISWEPFRRVFADSYAREMIYRTVRVGVFTTLLTLVLAYPVTLWMRELTPRWRGVLVTILLSPLLMSIVVRTLGWVVLLGPGGFINDALERIGLGPVRFLYTEAAIVFGLGQVLLGFMVLALLTTVLRIPDTVVAAGANLGARPWQVLWHIVLPMTRPGILAGAAIVFPLSASAYVTPALLGGSRNPVMATEVYIQAIVQLQFDRAAAIALVLFALVGIGVAVLGVLGRNRGGTI